MAWARPRLQSGCSGLAFLGPIVTKIGIQEIFEIMELQFITQILLVITSGFIYSLTPK